MADGMEELLFATVEARQRNGGQSSRKEGSKVYTKYLREVSASAKDRKAAVFQPPHGSRTGSTARGSCWQRFVKFFVTRIGEDWLFLLILGVAMALLSFFIDYAIGKVSNFHVYLYYLLEDYMAAQFFVWILYPLLLLMFAIAWTNAIAPVAAGSGIPEMKSVLRGVDLPHYLSMKALVAKSVGLIAGLGSGIPIGKEGPFVHMASILGHNLSRILTNINTIYLNESRVSELLAAACAVGVSSNFAAPVGGVLFSIEVTSTYFAVRNYWRGFFAAICSAFCFRFLSFWVTNQPTMTTLFTTHFRQDVPFNLPELVAHIILGAACGVLGALFVKLNRTFVLYRRRKAGTGIWKLLDANRYVFPMIWVLVIMSLQYPAGLGKYFGGEFPHKKALTMMFSNVSWHKAATDASAYPGQESEVKQLVDAWATHTNLFLSLVLFFVIKFVTAAVSITLPVPAGVFFPVFLLGATFGRLVGEVTTLFYPQSLAAMEILPGGYAVVGAAAMAGAVTHTISTAVIVYELTGQLTHIIPVMMGVLVANGIAQLLQPSIYDSGIMLRKLPYIPDMKRSRTYAISAGDMMRTNLFTVSYRSTYAELMQLLKDSKFQSYPLVDSPDSMVLLGSIQRGKVQQLLHEYIWDVHLKQSTVPSRTHSASSSLHSSHQSLCDFQDIQMSGATTPPLPALEEEVDDDMVVFPAITAPLTPAFDSDMAHAEQLNDTHVHVDVDTEHDHEIALSRPALSHQHSSDAYNHHHHHHHHHHPHAHRPVRSRTPSAQDLSGLHHHGHRDGVHSGHQRERASTLPRRMSLSERPSSLHGVREPLKRSSSTSSLVPARLANETLIQSARQSITSITGLDLQQLEEKIASRPRRLKRSLGRRMSQVAGLLLPSGEDQAEQLTTLTDQLVDACVKQDRTIMDAPVDLISSHIDSSPFQVVETTSFPKIHTLFSLLALNHMYVTSVGRLVGVITIEEVRNSVDGLDKAVDPPQNISSAHTVLEEIELEDIETPVTPNGMAEDDVCLAGQSK